MKQKLREQIWFHPGYTIDQTFQEPYLFIKDWVYSFSQLQLNDLQ